jgi:Tol biopolymer transport system component
MPKPRALLADPGTFSKVSWSPDGRWLLFAWPDADAWLFVRPEHPGHVETVGDINRQFSPGASSSGAGGFPRPAGWCCTVAGTG